AEVRALAEEITADAATTHEKAVALQTWFRDATLFRYDTRVAAARSDDAVWDFLTDRRGYCVQYATAMTVMARSLGIPARLGVGFLPGRTTSGGERVVTGRLAHTWPELWFAESGWVRFEPTPAVQTGLPPAYADPFAAVPVTPEDQEPPAPAGQPTTSPTQAPQGGTGPRGGEVAPGGQHVPRVLVLGVAAVLALAALVVGLRRPPRPPADAEAAWALLRRRLARSGVAWSDARTPRAVGAELTGRLDSRRDPAATEARAAVAALVAALEAERYAPKPSTPEPERLGAWVTTVHTALSERGRTAEERAPEPAGRT